MIKQREIDAGKEDGFSNPQIRVGANIGPVLLRTGAAARCIAAGQCAGRRLIPGRY
ncbi:hypothetical protein LP415_05200 [Polaromonas sp. P1(28)-8]|nr:hypothetical protein LP415_05200 [Polaromonas sp. P1(28)-8]